MHYLITGGAGFIGSHLAERLLREGHQVTVMDDLCTGSMHNIEHLKHKPGFEYVIDTIKNRIDDVLEAWLVFQMFDVVHRPGAEIVHHCNLVSFAEKPFGQM